MESREPKYLQIYSSLRDTINAGTYAVGNRLPAEYELGQMYGACRTTVSRALRELETEGRIQRRTGSGTYVTGAVPKSHTFGLVIPDFGQTEIFESICQGMLGVEGEYKHLLIWGESLNSSQISEADAKRACGSLVSQKVSGVFFAPFESSPSSNKINRAVVEMLSEHHVPTVLLDRDVFDYPQRSHFDLVGINNRRAGYILTQHLIHAGCRRIGFVGHAHLAPSCVARSHGYRDALAAFDLEPGSAFVELLGSSDPRQISEMIKRYRPDGLVCSNDRTAAELMQVLDQLGFAIPEQIKIVGFDDVKYAHLVKVPLTTIQQPCANLGAAATRAMFDRIKSPDMPPETSLLTFAWS